MDEGVGARSRTVQGTAKEADCTRSSPARFQTRSACICCKVLLLQRRGGNRGCPSHSRRSVSYWRHTWASNSLILARAIPCSTASLSHCAVCLASWVPEVTSLLLVPCLSRDSSCQDPKLEGDSFPPTPSFPRGSSMRKPST